MEKEPQPDSLSTVTVKEYPPSEVYSTEPPPAYHRSRQSTPVQVARIAAITVIVVSFILGTFMLASAYVQANASCAHLQQELMLLQEAAERFQPPEPLVQNEQDAIEQNKIDTPKKENDIEKSNKVDMKNNDNTLDSSSESDEDSDESNDADNKNNNNEQDTIHIKLPLQLDFDELAGALIDKNQKSRMNCVVEKKRADEVIDHQPKTLLLPFGLNLTTDPRYEHVTGEKMVIYCESGNEHQRQVPQAQNEEVMMHIQPIIIPLADTVQQIPMHHQPPPFIFQQLQPQQQQQPQHQSQQQIPFLAAINHHQQPQPQPAALRNGPMIPPPHIIAEHVAHIQRIAAAQHQQQMAQQQQQQQQQQTANMPQQITIIPQAPRLVQQPPVRFQPMSEAFFTQQQRLPIPEEILTQINRLPNEDVIAIQVSEENDEPQQQQQQQESQQQQKPEQQQQQDNVMESRDMHPDMNIRQAYARGLPVNIPVPMMQDIQQPAPESEQSRPHFVHPRSVRSVDNPLLREKRVKRCACDCAC